MAIDICALKKCFADKYARDTEIVVKAPGRVNIIGEHTDYNHGFVLPMALECATVIAASPRTDGILRAYAANLDRSVEIPVDRFVRYDEEPWIDYVVGVASEVNKLGFPLHGADIVIQGDVPLGCGLSSSASLEMAALCLFETLGGFRVEGVEAPRLGQRVENGFLGLSSGIMDQFISRMGKSGHALFLDCRSLDFELVPVAFEDATFVVANTCVARGLTASKYNERVAECRAAVAVLQNEFGAEGTHLRDFTLEQLEACKGKMDDVAFRRARHVITEDDRTIAACEAMRKGDAVSLGALMTASDLSLRDDYEVTCDALDKMTAVARQFDGCFGARMTGAGFGGCTIHLVRKDKVDPFVQHLLAGYKEATGLDGEVIISAPGDGAGRIE